MDVTCLQNLGFSGVSLPLNFQFASSIRQLVFGFTSLPPKVLNNSLTIVQFFAQFLDMLYLIVRYIVQPPAQVA